jgi:hypothetical protein
MQIKDLGENQNAFEIRQLQAHSDFASLNKSTIDLTLRNMTKRVPDYDEYEIPPSDTRSKINPDLENSNIENKDYAIDTIDSDIEGEEIIEMDEDPAEVRERNSEALSATLKAHEISFMIMQAVFLMFVFAFLTFYDHERESIYTDLMVSPPLIYFGVRMIYEMIRKRIKNRTTETQFTRFDKIHLFLGIIFTLEGCTNIISTIIFFYDAKMQIFKYSSFVAFSFLSIVLLCYRIIKEVELFKSLGFLLFKCLHVAFFVNSIANMDIGLVPNSWSVLWLYYLLFCVVALRFFFEIYSFLLVFLQIFLGLIAKSILWSNAFRILSSVYLMLFLTILIFNSVWKDKIMDMSVLAIHVILYVCVAFKVVIFFLYKIGEARMQRDIANINSENEKAKTENRIKIKAEVPIYLRKRKNDSYFQKVKKSELANIKIFAKQNISSKAISLKPLAKKNMSKNDDLSKQIVGSFTDRRLEQDKNFKISFPVQALTYRVEYKKKVNLREGIQLSFRKFADQKKDELHKNSKAANQIDNFDSQRDRILENKETENSISLDQNSLGLDSNTNDRELNDAQAVDNISKSKLLLNHQYSDRNNNHSVREEADENCCLICYANKSSVIIMPCGHADLCLDCGKDIWSSNGQCFICQTSINYMLVVEEVAEDIYKVTYSLYLKK